MYASVCSRQLSVWLSRDSYKTLSSRHLFMWHWVHLETREKENRHFSVLSSGFQWFDLSKSWPELNISICRLNGVFCHGAYKMNWILQTLWPFYSLHSHADWNPENCLTRRKLQMYKTLFPMLQLQKKKTVQGALTLSCLCQEKEMCASCAIKKFHRSGLHTRQKTENGFGQSRNNFQLTNKLC